MATRNDEFNILKSNDDLMIGGYASIVIVDKQQAYPKKSAYRC